MVAHIVKLCVGADRIADLADWQRQQIAHAHALGLPARPVCGTRNWPKRAGEVLAGGSLYWVIGGLIRVRQRIVEIAPVTDSHGPRCGLYLDATLIPTEPVPRRPFQGWRYLDPADAPADLGAGGENELPVELRAALREAGVG